MLCFMKKFPGTILPRISPVLALLCLTALAAVGWAALMDQDGGSAVRFGAHLEGKEPFQRNIDEAFAPASNSKLFTAGALLDHFGADYRYPTVLRWTEVAPGVAAGVTLTGSGDPSWGMPQFGENIRSRVDLIADGMKAAGVNSIRGTLRALSADPRWDVVNIPQGWESEDIFSCGGSLGLSFNLNTNCATYKLSAPARGAWLPAGLSAPVLLSVTEGAGTSLRIRLVKTSEGAQRFSISGTLKKGDSRSFTLPVLETRAWAANLLRLALEAKGIRFEEGILGDDRGSPKELVFYSKPLSELIKPFLKNSVNFMGDAFLKAIAVDPSSDGKGDLLAPALVELKSYLIRLGLQRDFEIHDGAGLSRTSRTTPRLITEFLTRVQREPYFPALLAALPIAGVDGTLRNRMKGTPAEGVLRAKTGTLEGVYNLAGYVPHGNELVPFVMLTKTTAANANVARRAEDRVGAKLAELHRGLLDILDVTQDLPYPYVPEQAGMDDQ